MGIFKIINAKWYYAITACIVVTILCFFGFSIQSRYILYISCFLPFLFLSVALVLGCIRMIRKDYLNGILQTFFAGILAIIVYGCFSFFLMFYPYDFFAEGLEIPKNIKFEKPLKLIDDRGRASSDKQDFVLYDYLQPGMYKYDLFLNKIEKGKVYLKIFEVTGNKILSQKSIRTKSEMPVENTTDELKRFELKDDFTIYEGDWGQFYGGKVEVWFKPDNLNKPDRKLITKNYIIQGWMR